MLVSGSRDSCSSRWSPRRSRHLRRTDLSTNGMREFVQKKRESLTWIGPRQLDVRLIVRRKGIGSHRIQLERTCTSFQYCVRRLAVEQKKFSYAYVRFNESNIRLTDDSQSPAMTALRSPSSRGPLSRFARVDWSLIFGSESMQ